MAKILVFGTDNIGAVYSVILHRAGAQVTCVCRSSYNQVKSHGLRVISTVLGDQSATPIAVRSIDEALRSSPEPFDFVLVCTKAILQDTPAILELIAPAVRSTETVIVLIQNGLGVERPFSEAFPDTILLSGVAYLPTTQVLPGVCSHSELELLHVGIYPSGSSSSTAAQRRLELFVSLIEAGGATAVAQADMQVQRWSKIVANGAVNPICALSKCSDKQSMSASPLGSVFLKEVMEEIAAIASSAGYGDVVNSDIVERQHARSLARPYPGVQPSMLADVLASRPLEVDAILGELVRIAQVNEVERPKLMTLYVLVQGLDWAIQARQMNLA